MAGLCLVPIYWSGYDAFLDGLSSAIERTFRLEVHRRPPWFDPEVAYDAFRGQYNSTILLELLLSAPAAEAPRILGVTGVDLFVPVLTYVFGEAQLDGRAAIVSAHRLDPEVYGLPPDPAVLTARLEREAIHELGHTLGLVHCAAPRCVMRASTYAEDIDLKDAEFCTRCRRAIRGKE